MDIEHVLAFWAASTLLIIVPGVDWAYTINAGLKGHVVSAVSGLAIGYLAMTILVAAGVGAFVSESPIALTILTLGGGAYLLWYGAQTYLHPVSLETGSDKPLRTSRSALLRGIGVSGLNPKGLLIFVAMLPQFASPEQSLSVGVQIAVLGVIFTVTCGIFYLFLGHLARTILHTRPTVARLVSKSAGIAMCLIGGLLFVERLLH